MPETYSPLNGAMELLWQPLGKATNEIRECKRLQPFDTKILAPIASAGWRSAWPHSARDNYLKRDMATVEAWSGSMTRQGGELLAALTLFGAQQPTYKRNGQEGPTASLGIELRRRGDTGPFV